MKKFLLMFAVILCGAVAFTSCDEDDDVIVVTPPDGDGDEESNVSEWQAGLDESKAPGELTLRLDMAGAKATYVATFVDGVCTKCVLTVEYMGQKTTEDFEEVVGMEYDMVKQIFQTLVDQYNGEGDGNVEEEGDEEADASEWQAGLDESKAPGELTLRLNMSGAKATYVATFVDGVCTKCVLTVEYMGQKTTEDFNDVVGMEYDIVKQIFQTLVDQYK